MPDAVSANFCSRVTFAIDATSSMNSITLILEILLASILSQSLFETNIGILPQLRCGQSWAILILSITSYMDVGWTSAWERVLSNMNLRFNYQGEESELR